MSNLCHGYDDEMVRNREKDQKTLDPNTLSAGPATDVMVAEWRPLKRCLLCDVKGWLDHSAIWGARYHCRACKRSFDWSPSTNPAHAGEARRKVDYSFVEHMQHECRAIVGEGVGSCLYDEVTGKTEEEIKGRAEALATCRAIAAAMKAKETL